ncbi:MAG TPA: hypothetical protein VKB43_07255 [Gaiellaceae bacterium]|nr:hypothetical protein [Gaiellaceae bacterium]
MSRGFAAADCQHSPSEKKRFAFGAEHKERGVTWCRVRYGPHTGWSPYPARLRHGVVLPLRGCREDGDWLVPSGFGFGNALRHVRAVCRERQGIGWYLTAVEGSTHYTSRPFPYTDPIAILSVYRFSPRSLPAILAQVGWGDTGQPYELFTFSGHRIVPVHMTFLHGGVWSGLAGGGAAFHGQGVFCTKRHGNFVLTQVDWDGPGGNAPMVHDKHGGTSPAPADRVQVSSERWTFSGQPLTQRSVVKLPVKWTTYRAAAALENAQC